MRKLKQIQHLTDSNNYKEKMYSWSVEPEYPHIIKRHVYSNKDEFFDTVDEAFIARRYMSPEYMKSHELREEFNRYANDKGTCTIK